MNCIFTITIVDKKLNNRCVGWYLNSEDAERDILSNNADLWEIGWKYAVIEKCMIGLYNYGGEDISWYEIKSYNPLFVIKINKPDIFKGIVNFGIG